MYPRQLKTHLKENSKKYPIVTVTGPRQSGKTTLIKQTFSDYQYVSLEDPDQLEFAQSDPRGFLQQYPKNVILDEAQNAPDLFSYLQTHTDASAATGQYILSGSQQFLLNEKITQSLSGRTAILRLVPLSLCELLKRDPQTYWQQNKLVKFNKPKAFDLYDLLFRGFYPRLHVYRIAANEFYRDYVETYLHRDVRLLVNVGDISKFQTFLRLVAGRCGQLVNLSSLGNDAGVDHTTIKRWLTVLESSYVIHLLQPHYANFNKRLTKAAKIYFLDTGLLCYLLKIQNSSTLPQHPLIGGIFETFVFSELYKNFSHQNKEIPLYYWRDHAGREIDILIDKGTEIVPIEVKSTQTIINSSLLKNINYWLNLQGNSQTHGCLIYAGAETQQRQENLILPWYMIS